MNERIKKLIELAGISVRGYYDETGSTPLELQKFAKLIVKECLDWCNAYASVDGTAQKIVESIKKDFGVE